MSFWDNMQRTSVMAGNCVIVWYYLRVLVCDL